MNIFADRADAGRQLAEKLMAYQKDREACVIGLARGGVLTAAVVARCLQLPLDLFVIRKVGAPGNQELAIGAISERGDAILNASLIEYLGVSSEYIREEIERQKQLVQQRLTLYRSDRAALDVENKTVIVVDDGVATGASMRVAVQSLRAAGAKKIVLATPVISPTALHLLEKTVDEAVYLYAPASFAAVGAFYKTFDQVSDEDVIKTLRVSLDSRRAG